MTRLFLMCLSVLPVLMTCVSNSWAQEPVAQPAMTYKPAKKPGLAIGAAFAPDGTLWMALLNATGQLTVMFSKDNGQQWSTPTSLDTGDDLITSDKESPIQLAISTKGLMVIAYNRPLGKPYTGEVRMLRSVDGGQTFSRPFTAHQDRQLIAHRFQSIGFDRDGRLHTVWIDKRDKQAAIAKSNPSSARTFKDEERLYPGAAIYRNVSRDGGETFEADTKVADYSCECCRIAMAPTAAGGMQLMWRHLFDDNKVRDHAMSTIPPAGQVGASSPLVRVTRDNWRIDACPHHGPALTSDSGSGFHATWFTLKGNEPVVYYGRFSALGQALQAPVSLPDPQASHATLIRNKRQLVIAWKSVDGQQTLIKAWLSVDEGKRWVQRVLDSSTEDNDYPVLLGHENTTLMLWSTRRGVKIQRIDFSGLAP